MQKENSVMQARSVPVLFTDGSFDGKSGIGYGAYLLVNDLEVHPEAVTGKIQTRRFENTSPARLELETLLWALKEVSVENKTIEIYTDSQTIIRLPERRRRLEQAVFRSKNNRLLSNYDLYIEFYRVTEALECRFTKAKGHQPSAHKDAVHRLFTLVDKASRRALRKDAASSSGLMDHVVDQ